MQNLFTQVEEDLFSRVSGDEIIKSVIGHKRARGRGDGFLGFHLGFTAPSRPYYIVN
jgi:hypothetical protein